MDSFKVICINANNRPNEIPTSLWIERGAKYTVVNAEVMNLQNRLLGFQLSERDLTECFPYTFFAANRFKAFTEEDAQAEKEVEELLMGVDELV